MSPEMLMQPFEQSFTVAPFNNGYYHPHHMHHHQHHRHSMMPEEDNMTYSLGYTAMIDGPPSGDFRPTFYNPFEIKHRRRTSRAQLKVLEKSFLENPKPNATVRRILAQKLDMTPRGVQIWFQNRRAKAKLQRRKSGEDQQQEQTVEEEVDQQEEDSPVLFSQFFNNLKAWDNSARSIANVAAASCMFENNGSSSDKLLDQQPASVKIEEWLKLPIHPLAPVIDSTDEFDFNSSPIMSTEEWRRKSCPALGLRVESPCWSNVNAYNMDRRMTEDLILSNNNSRFVQPYPILKSNSLTVNGSECNTPRWGSTQSNSMDFYSGMNYSPISQQLTPMLSTGSPVSSVDGNYYDSCLDLIMSSSSTTGSASSMI